MESFGKLLRTSREKKDIDIETASHDTSISQTYLEALEMEQIDKFPGETYLTGFLKNYSEYLDLDPDQMLSLYRAKKIQESPAPESLLQKNAPRFLKPLIICSVLIALAGVGCLLYFFVYSKNKNNDAEQTVLSSTSATEQYVLSASQPVTKRVYKGDVISVPTEGGNIDIVVAGTLGVLQLMTPAGTQYLELSEERELDIDGVDGAEIIVYVSDISRTDESRGAEVRVLLKDGTYMPVAATDTSIIPEAADIENQRYIILQDNRAYPFTINVTFRNSCVFRYRTDSRDEIEDYYVAGNVLTMQASNGIRIWVSNINAVKFQVQADSRSYDLEVGKAGQVAVQDIKWIRDTDGSYKLAVIELD